MVGSANVAILLVVASQCATESSSISFSPLPSVPEPVSTSADTSHGLAGFYGLARSVVDAIRPGNLPHDAVGELVAAVSDQLGLDWGISPSDTNIRGLVDDFLRWLAPTIAAMALGVLLAVVIPVAGCCILCCRACGRCGAKSMIYRKKNQNVKCLVLTSVFLATTSMIFVGATIGAVSVMHVSQSLGELESTVNTALTDVDNYLESGGKQVFFVADDQFAVLEAHVLNDIDRIGEWFEQNIGGSFKSNALHIINETSSLLAILREIDGLVVSSNALIRDVKNTTQTLVSQVSNLSTNLETLGNQCMPRPECNFLSSADFAVIANFVDVRNLETLGNQCMPLPECNFLSSADFAVTVNFADIGEIEFNDEIDFSSIEQDLEIARDMFQNMAEFIDSEAKEYELDQRAETEFSNIHSTLEYDYLNALNETIENIVSEGGHIDNARDAVHNALKYMDDYEALWKGVGLLLVCLFFLIISLFLVGSFCGSFRYSREAQPHSRSSVSNCGGRCILVGIFTAFVTSPVLMLAASVTLGLATGVQKVCEDLEPPDYPIVREVADDPAVWGGLTLVGLVTREETNTAVNLSVYQSLSHCADNEPLWKALDGDRLYSYADLDDTFNCTSLGVGSEDFQPFDSFTSDDIFPYLADVNQSFSEIDFREFKEMINEIEFLSFDLTELEGNLTVITNSSGPNTTVYELVSQILDDLMQIEATVQTLQLLRESAEGNVTKLENDVQRSENEVPVLSDNLEQFVIELHDVVSTATEAYLDRLCGFVDDYIDYVNGTIRNELGRCGVFPAAYGAVYSTVCENAVDGLNGYWLAVGWSMLFTVVAIVVGVILSDYFRRAGTQVVRCTDTSTVSETTSFAPLKDNDDDVSLIHMRPKGKSYPSNAKALPEEQEPLNTTQMNMEW